MEKFQLGQKRKSINVRKKREKLQKLYQMLTYESSAIITMSMIPIIGFVVLSVILSIAVIFFVPIMLRTLWQLEKRGWLVALVLLNVVPYIISIIFASNMLIYTIFSSIECSISLLIAGFLNSLLKSGWMITSKRNLKLSMSLIMIILVSKFSH